METIISGWLLDVYPDPENDPAGRAGVVIWILEDPREKGGGEIVEGRRLRLRQNLPVTFYASGSTERLRALWQFLKTMEPSPSLSKIERPCQFQSHPQTVMSIKVDYPTQELTLVEKIQSNYPDTTLYDIQIPTSMRYAATYGILPLSRVKVEVGEKEWIQKIEAIRDGDPYTPSMRLRTMRIEPDTDPRYDPPRLFHVQAGQKAYHFSVEPARSLLANISSLIRRYDPDLLITAWGDGRYQYSGLLRHLVHLAEKGGIELPLHRETNLPATASPGDICLVKQDFQLLGRWHIDMFNSWLFYDHGMEGIYNFARLTSLPVQQAARSSPEQGFYAAQTLDALQQGLMIPWNPQAPPAHQGHLNWHALEKVSLKHNLDLSSREGNPSYVHLSYSVTG